MLFNSFDFLLFFPLVVVAYFALPHRGRWVLLLAASYYFYACWKPEYLLLIAASTLVDYLAGLQMARRATRRARRPFLALSLATNLGLLFAFKYANFFGQSVQDAFDRFDVFADVPVFHLLLPVGISFYTFQTLAYAIDVYRGRQEAERHLGYFALYVSFFPQLVAGPIERAQSLLPQLRARHAFDAQRAADGLKLMMWGFFKKLVIADRLALYVNTVYGAPDAYSGWPLIIATYFFAWQVYCDFSGYSDIAIGAAKVMGIDLMENFRRPFFSKSIGELWRRWHISLSTWFRDYLYIPLGGNRVPRRRWLVNLFVVFLLSGLWHGAGWTFVVWGGLHGVYLIVGILTHEPRQRAWAWVKSRLWSADAARVRTAGLRLGADRLQDVVGVLVTFHLFVFSLLIFRAPSIGEAASMITRLPDLGGLGTALVPGFGLREMGIALAMIALLEGVHLFQRHGSVVAWLNARSAPLRWGAYYALLALILLFGIFAEQEFIYFRF